MLSDCETCLEEDEGARIMNKTLPLMLGLLLHCMVQIKEERSFAMIKAVLRGRKTQQTIQDTWYYGLVPYYQLLPFIRDEQLDMWYEQFLNEGLVHDNHRKNHSSFQLTTAGDECYRQWFKTDTTMLFFQRIEERNGFLQETVEVQWQTLQLLTQVCSHKMQGISTFLPVIEHSEIQQRVKIFLRGIQSHDEYQQLGSQLRQELAQILHKWKPYEQQLLLLRLGGLGISARTYTQIAHHLQLEDGMEAQLYFQVLNAAFWKQIEVTDSPILQRLLSPRFTDPTSLLTASTRVTYGLLQQYQGPTTQLLSWLAEKRQLKLGTVEDHLVEIACKIPAFTIQPYVNPQLEQAIIEQAQQLQTRRLAPIKEHLGGQANYFQIRLVLSRMGWMDR